MGLTWSPENAKPVVLDRAAGTVELSPRKSKVLICGCGLGKQHAPITDLSWEVWCINLIPAFYRGKVRADRWFDIHQRQAQTEQDLKWIAECQVPIYVPEDLVDAGPMCVRFPFERLEREFGTAYWACTFAYQIALALSEGFEEIGLYGVELAYGTRRERTVEYACVSWWLGYAAACGVKVSVPPGSRMARHPYRYGIEYKAEIDDVNALLSQLEKFDVADAQRRRERESVGG